MSSRTIELFRQHTEKQEEEKAERQKAPPRNKEREEHAANEYARLKKRSRWRSASLWLSEYGDIEELRQLVETIKSHLDS
jgi:hypothetical protein